MTPTFAAAPNIAAALLWAHWRACFWARHSLQRASLHCWGPDMLQALIFALLYLRNLPTFDGNHTRTKAATHMDMALRERRKRPRGKP